MPGSHPPRPWCSYPNAPMRQVYTCAGRGTEVYRTHFSYFGFRYIGVTGFPGTPSESALTAHFVHSAVPHSGQFSSSSALLDAVHHATRYSALSNLMDVPTDCPQVGCFAREPLMIGGCCPFAHASYQRERRGWLGDAQLTFETVVHNFDSGAFCRSSCLRLSCALPLTTYALSPNLPSRQEVDARPC